MTEFLLTLPLLMVVLGLMLFMGWSHMRKQHVVVANRYMVWRSLEGGTRAPHAANSNLLENPSVDRPQTQGPEDARDRWLEATDDIDAEAALMAEEFFTAWPKGKTMDLTARYSPPLPVARSIDSTLSYAFGREGEEWVRRRANEWEVLRERYYPILHEQLGNINGAGEPLAQRMISLYDANW